MKFVAGFEKVALNAQKARALAKEHGLIPEGAWKWALRNLRHGKSPQDLGMAPTKMVRAARRIGRNVESGAYWGHGAKGGKSQLGKGTPVGYDFGNSAKPFMNKFLAHPAGKSALAGKSPTSKEVGSFGAAYKRMMEPVRKFNSIHTHPIPSQAGAARMEKSILEGLRKSTPAQKKELEDILSEAAPPQFRHRAKALSNPQEMINALSKRYNSSKPNLMPSGMPNRAPYFPKGSDVHQFLQHHIGTHHNIVSGHGVGVHTVRPDKEKGGKRLRTALFTRPGGAA